MSRGLHLGAMLGFFALGPLFGLGGIYLAGAGVVAAVLVVEQLLVAHKQANIPMAFFTLNGVVSVGFFLVLLTDRLVGV